MNQTILPKSLGLLCCLLLTACAGQLPLNTGLSTSTDLYRQQAELFGPEIAVPPPTEIFQLSTEQQASFTQYYQKQRRTGVYSDTIVFDYLSKSLAQFNYYSDTYVARETLEKMQGNCLSLAILTTALVSLTDASVEYELVDATPVFARQNDIIERGVHVRSKIFRPEEEMLTAVYSTSKGTVIDYFPARVSRFLNNVSNAVFVAMYYNNIAAQYLADGEVNTAYWYSLAALDLAPNYAPHINTMAVIYRRAGDLEQAEKIYQYAQTQPTDQLVILKNYRAMLALQKRYQAVAELDKKIAQHYDPNPYAWVDLGDESYRLGELDKAKLYYQKSVQLAPYIQHGYLGLAKVWLAKGNVKKTEQMLRKAMANSYQQENTQRYQAKLDALAQLH